jgi:hypothetical protein
MKSRMVRIAVGTVALGTVVAGVTFVVRSSKKVSTARGGVSLSKPSLALCGIEQGVHFSYKLRVETNGQIDLASLGGNSASGFSVTGLTSAETTNAIHHLTTSYADFVAMQVGPDNVVLAGRFRDFRSEGTSKLDVPAQMAEPFLLRIDSECKIVDFARSKNTSLIAARGQQALAHELQWHQIKAGSAERTGQNNLGEYQSTVERKDDVLGGLVERRITNYSKLWNVAGATAGLVRKPEASLMSVRFGRGPWFDGISASESTATLSLLNAKINTSVVRIPNDGDIALSVPSVQSNFIWENLLPKNLLVPVAVAKAPLSDAERKELSKKTLKVAVSEFVANTKDGMSMKDTWPRLARIIEARPDLARPLARKLVSGEVPPEATAGMFVALGNAHVTEARDALLEINQDPHMHMMDRARAAFALVPRDDVGVEFAEVLRKDTSGITAGSGRPERIYAREAALALGMMAALKTETAPDVKRVAVDAVKDMLGQGHRWHELRPAFSTIANIGDPSLLSLAAPYTQSSDPLIRKASAVVIRRMKPEDSERFALDWMRRERDPDVKRQIYNHLQSQLFDAQQAPTADVLAQAVADLQSDPPPQLLTRQSILRIISSSVQAKPELIKELRPILVKQLEHEYKTQTGLGDLISPLLQVGDIETALIGVHASQHNFNMKSNPNSPFAGAQDQ